LTLILEAEPRLADELGEMFLDLCLMLAMTISFLSTSSHPRELISEFSTRQLHKNTGGTLLAELPTIRNKGREELFFPRAGKAGGMGRMCAFQVWSS